MILDGAYVADHKDTLYCTRIFIIIMWIIMFRFKD
jgi:hypothetical protein